MELRNVWKIYSALLFGTFVTIEAAAFQAPALPSIARHFAIPINLAALILILYFLALTVFAPIMGRLGDQIGRKLVLSAGLCLFAVSEFIAALSPNFSIFLAARFLQGLGVACILPGIYAYVANLFPEEKRGIGLGVLTLTMALGAASGGLLGGLLIDRFGWPSVYWVSGVLALLGLLPITLFVPEIRSATTPGRFDLKGASYLFFTISAFLSLPTWIGNFGIKSPYILGILLVGIFSFTMLWRNSTRTSMPVVDVNILRLRAFALPTAVYWLAMLCSGSIVLSLAFFINNRPGGSASQVGLMIMFLCGGTMISAPIAGRLIDKLEPRSVSIFSLLGILIGLFMFININVGTSLWFIIATVSVFGLMVGATTPALMKLAIGAIPNEKMGAGTGLFSMLRDLGSPTGSAFALALFSTSYAYHVRLSVSMRGEKMGITPEKLEQFTTAITNKGKATSAAMTELIKTGGSEYQELARLANIDGLSAAILNVGYLVIGIIGFALLLSLHLGKIREKRN